jgi:glycosyltransferase involved in cell wall biosynthesis
VLFVVWQAGPRADGGVTSITEIMRRLRRVRAIVVTQRESRVTEQWREAGLEVHVLPLPEPPQRPALRRLALASTRARFNAQVALLARKRKVDVVHCNDVEALQSSLFGARLLGLPVVFNVRNVKADEERYGIFWQVAARTVQRMIALSRDMATRLERRLPIGRVEHIYSVVDFERMKPLAASARAEFRARLGLPRDAFLVVYAANVTPRKRQAELVAAAKELLSELPNCYLYFVGDFAPESPYGKACSEAAVGFPRAVFVGYAPNVHEWLAAADVSLIASHREGLARSMIESLACGTPVVSMDVCSAREILEQHGVGYVVPQGDYQGMIAKVRELAEQPEKRAQLAQRGIALSHELFHGQDNVAAYEDIYLELRKAE